MNIINSELKQSVVMTHCSHTHLQNNHSKAVPKLLLLGFQIKKSGKKRGKVWHTFKEN